MLNFEVFVDIGLALLYNYLCTSAQVVLMDVVGRKALNYIHQNKKVAVPDKALYPFHFLGEQKGGA